MVDGRFWRSLIVTYAGSVASTPRPISPNAIKKPKGLYWEYQSAAPDAGGQPLFSIPTPLAARVGELGR
jgi:hypothetical protein